MFVKLCRRGHKNPISNEMGFFFLSLFLILHFFNEIFNK
jgi:hypothetical protein